MAEITLEARHRPYHRQPPAAAPRRGQGARRRVRAGQGAAVRAVVWRDLRHALTGEAGLNALIDLHVDGATGDLVIVKEMQRHPVRRDVLHVDFLRVSRDVAITVEVPIVLHGEATA